MNLFRGRLLSEVDGPAGWSDDCSMILPHVGGIVYGKSSSLMCSDPFWYIGPLGPTTIFSRKANHTKLT